MQKNTNQKWLIIFFWWFKDMFKSLSLSLSLFLSLSLSQFFQFKCALLAWQNYTFVLPKQLQLGCSQVVHIWINRNKNKNNNSNKTNI